MAQGKTLSIATCQFVTSADVRKNARYVCRHMRQAKKRGADVAHFPETCLSGYCGTDFESWHSFDWDVLRAEVKAIARLAQELKLWVVLGSSHQLSGKHKPHNSLYIISAAGRLVTRYDKRMCTGADLQHYSPGNHTTTFSINGVKCAAMICYEVRFPELYRQYQQKGVQLMFHSFYNAHAEKDNIHTVIMRASLQAHAATNYMWVSASNAATAHQTWPSVFIYPHGVIHNSLKQGVNGIMVNTLDTSEQHYDAAGPYRNACIKGRLYSGKLVTDARSDDLKSW